jgi:opacity protein-like surface antigen
MKRLLTSAAAPIVAFAYCDFTTGTRFQPFVSGGVGQAHLDCRRRYGDAEVAYRYFGGNDIKIEPDTSPSLGDHSDQAVTLGLTYAFGG